MPPEEEQNHEEPVCQSVLLFACKGVIEGIIVLLFIWLLVQVLFTKHLEVHLQILLSVGLVGLCFTLFLGCFLCWCRTRHKPPEDKKDVTSPPPPDSVDHVAVASSPSPSSGTTFTKLQYEELDGEDYPSAFESSTPSDEDWSSAVSDVKQKVCFQMRRLSSPAISTSLYRPMTSSRSSLPSFPRLSLLAKTRKTLECHCSVADNGDSFSEHKGQTIPSPESHYTCSSLQTQDLLAEEPLIPDYGSNDGKETSSPFLHFTLTFSQLHNTLTVSLVGITGDVHSLDEVHVQVRLLPLCPEPLDTSAQDQSLSCVLHDKNLVVNVGSLERLKSCFLRLSVFSEDHPTTSLLGELDVCCGGLDWTIDRPVSCIRELRQVVDNTEVTL